MSIEKQHYAQFVGDRIIGIVDYDPRETAPTGQRWYPCPADACHDWVLDEDGETVRPKTEQEKYDLESARIRAERDSLIEAIRWRIERHRDEVEAGLAPTEPLAPLLLYAQELRDVPQQADFPHSIEWPEVPEAFLEPTEEPE